VSATFFWPAMKSELCIPGLAEPTERLMALGKLDKAYGGSILGSNQFTLLPQLPSKQCSIQNRHKNNDLTSLI